MFDADSRYVNVSEATLTTDEGREVRYVQRRFLPQSESLQQLTQVTVKEGDRLDQLSATTLGQADQWWRIADANEAMCPDDLLNEPGRLLTVPIPQA